MLQTETRILRNGKRLRLARTGSGSTLVFLHGYPENLQIWSRLIAILSPEYECVALDWPGMGESEEWDGGATPKHMAERLKVILGELGLDSPSIVAMDMGGQAALDYAARFPDHIRNLIVMNSLVFGDERTSWEIRLLRKYGWNRWILRNFPAVVFRRAQRTFLSDGAILTPELAQDFWSSFQRDSVRRFISKMCSGYQGTLPALALRYTEIRCRTLVLWGQHDKHFPVAQAQRLQRTIPGAELVILAGAGHWMAYQDAARVADAASRFLKARSSIPD